MTAIGSSVPQCPRQQTDGQPAPRLLPDWLWIAVGLALFVAGIVLLAASGPTVATHPFGTCEAVISVTTSDGKQVNLEPGWCSQVALTVPQGFSKTAGGLDVGTQVWFVSDKDGLLILLKKDEGAGAARPEAARRQLSPLIPLKPRRSPCCRRPALAGW
jgi:hypothetical protein